MITFDCLAACPDDHIINCSTGCTIFLNEQLSLKFIEVINRLGKLCKFSPKFCRELEKCKLLHGNTSVGKLKQIFTTRWLSFNDCIEAMVKCIDSLISCLHSVKEDSAHGVTSTGLLKNVASYKFIASTYFWSSSITAVMILGEKDGPYMEEFQTLVAASPPTEFPMGTRFMSHDISDSERQRNEFLSVRKSMVSIAWRTGSLIQGL